MFVFKNGLQTLWLSYLTDYVDSQSEYLTEYYKQFEQTKNITQTIDEEKVKEFIMNMNQEQRRKLLKEIK